MKRSWTWRWANKYIWESLEEIIQGGYNILYSKKERKITKVKKRKDFFLQRLWYFKRKYFIKINISDNAIVDKGKMKKVNGNIYDKC